MRTLALLHYTDEYIITLSALAILTMFFKNWSRVFTLAIYDMATEIGDRILKACQDAPSQRFNTHPR